MTRLPLPFVSARAPTAMSLALVLAAFAGCAESCPAPVPDAGPLEPAPSPPEPDGFHDPLSMPEEPTLSTLNFTPSQTCGTCHQNHYDQWKTSMHAYAVTDPVFRALVRARQADLSGTEDPFCMQCHTPIGVRGGEVFDNFTFEGLNDVAKDGISCETCHKTSEVVRPYNNGHVIDEFGPMRGPIDDPVESNFHTSAPTTHMSESNFCGACHDVVEVSGLNLERPYAEWLESPGGKDGRTCQSCHMPTYTGKATTVPADAPERELHSHFFTGVDIPLVDGILTPDELAEQKERIHDLLTDIAQLTLAVDTPQVPAGGQIDLYVNVENLLDSHNLPTGTTFIRQMWVEVKATDATGRVLYETGTLDANGDLKNHFSALEPYADNDLIQLGSELIDAFGTPTIFSWRAVEHTSFSLSPLYDRTYTLFVPTDADVVGPVEIEARLQFRSHAPHILRAVGMADKVDDIEIHTLALDDLSVSVVGGGLTDGGIDAGVLDAGILDAGILDAGNLDAGPFDAGVLDAGALDAGALDAGTFDAGAPDGG